MSLNLSSPGHRDDNCGSTSTSEGSPLPVAEPATEEASEEVPEEPDPSPTSSRSSTDISLGFAEFMDSLDLPPGVTTLTEDTPQSPGLRETVMNIRYLVAEMYSGEKDLRKIQYEKEALHKLAMPPPPMDPLLGYPFALKVFMAASSIGISAINWAEEGRELEVDYLELQDHLTTGRSIFRCRSITQFIDQLLSHGFTRILKEEMEPAKTYRPVRLYFEHPDFARGELGALQKLLVESEPLKKCPGKKLPAEDEAAGTAEEDEDKEKGVRAERLLQFRVPLHLPAPGQLSRMRLRGDKCCSSSPSIRSSLQVARCRFRTLLEHLATASVLQATSQVRNNSLMKGRPWEYPPFASSSVKFVKPHDSVILLDADNPPDYAGYYGQVETALVTKFFSDYLPRYGSKTTGYKDIVLETNHKPSNFQQNLPIGLAYSDGEDNDHDEVLPPVSPAELDSDMDCKPSTSAAAAAALRSSSGRKRAAEDVEDQDLEEAMQELCGGSTVLKENVSGSRGKAKAPQPKTPKATPRKRPTKCLESSSSETEAPVSQKGKRAKRESVQDSRKSQKVQLETTDEQKGPLFEEVLFSSRGKSKAPKAKPRKRLTSSSEDEATASPKAKKLKKGVQVPRKKKNIQPKDLDEEDEEETLVEKTPEEKLKLLQSPGEDDEDEDEDEVAEEIDVEDAEEQEQAQEEDAEEAEQTQEMEDAEAEAEEEPEDEEDPEEDEDEDPEENEEDDDDDDYNVQYRAAPQDPEKPRRYDLRNSKRQPH